jgi:hypothetical protein
MDPITTTNTGAQSDGDSDWMQPSQAESEEPSEPKVLGPNEIVLQSASSGEGYSADLDCSASDQASDQSFDCAACGQKQRSTMKLALNRLDLNHTSSDMESSSSLQGGSSLANETTEPGTILSVSKAEASSSTVKRSLSSRLTANNNPGRNRRHRCSEHHHYRRHRSWPRPRAHDHARDSSNDLNAFLLDYWHKELANTPMIDGTPALPQWKYAHISHPMDPRIDISTVGHVQSTAPALATTAASLPMATTTRNGSTCTYGDTGSTSNTFVATTSLSVDLPSIETYTQLLSVS